MTMKEIIAKQMLELQKLGANKRRLAYQMFNLALIVFSVLMIWKGLMVVTHSDSPIVVVLSGSMEPGIQRGDVLFLNNATQQVNIGDIVVYKIKDRSIPIVHRILQLRRNTVTDHMEMLTKGDANRLDDSGLYEPGQRWISRQDILGKATGTLRYVGMVTIILNEYPIVKHLLIGLMGLFVLTST